MVPRPVPPKDRGPLERAPILYVAVSASLFGISAPLAKLLVEDLHPVALAGLLYLGAFLGLSMYDLFRRARHPGAGGRPAPLARGDLPYLAGAVLAGGFAGPVLLMTGLTLVSGFAASLLLNLEAVATVTIAGLVFREHLGRRLWLAISLMTAGSVILTWDPSTGTVSPLGPILVVLAMVCWGIDNNLTRAISGKDAVHITTVKGLVAGSTSTALAWALGAGLGLTGTVAMALLLGALSYGASLVLFIRALEGLGAARTGTLFAVAPFVGALVSLVVLREWLGWTMVPAAAGMAAGVWLIAGERHHHGHVHAELVHDHMHRHDDGHHDHMHVGEILVSHSHDHVHEPLVHVHAHWPDDHHRHGHGRD